MGEKLTKQEIEQIKILLDPVLWAEATLRDPKNTSNQLSMRKYQKRMLRDDSKRKVSRCGRRIGKCKSYRSKIITSDGPIKVQELHEMNPKDRPAILTFNQDTQEIVATKDYYIMDNGPKPIYKLTTSTGRVNYATGNHPYLTIDVDGTLGWMQVDDMVAGDRIAVPSTYEDLIEGKPVGEELSRLLGYLVGDGGTNQRQISFTNFEQSIVDDLDSVCNKFGGQLSKQKTDGQYNVVILDKDIDRLNPIRLICEEHGLLSKLATQKEAPPAIMAGTKEDIRNFIGAYWDCDGWCSIQNKTYDKAHKRPRVEVGACSSSEQLAKDIQHLLLRLGIVSRLKEKKVKYNDEYRQAWQITIGDADNIRRFSQEIKLVSSKSDSLSDILKLLDEQKLVDNGKLSSIPQDIWSYIKSKQSELGLSNMEVCGAESRKDHKRLRTEYAPSRSKLAEYAKNLDGDEYLLKLATNNILWDEVVSIEYMGEEQTYDLTVPETHTFIADDIISHNTITMVVHILWYAFTHANSKQVIATPYDSQITVIFDMIRQFIDSAPELSESIESMVKTPHQRIKLKNGSLISGFTAGTRSGASGGSLRGQAADWIYMDEVDYMTDEDFETIYSISLEAPERIGVWISSTPTGRRGKFWAACQKGSGWTEFYYPTMVNPEWSPRLEKELRAMYSEQGYIHEVLAEFGDETIGVFKKDQIDRARQPYNYINVPTNNAIRAVGVDWDKLFVPIKWCELLETPKAA